MPTKEQRLLDFYIKFRKTNPSVDWLAKLRGKDAANWIEIPHDKDFVMTVFYDYKPASGVEEFEKAKIGA